MGYTHYVEVKEPLTQESWDEFVKLKEDILRNHYNAGGCRIEDNSTSEYLNLNGVGEDSHENLVLYNKSTPFTFCKTAQKPYDVVITAVLCAFKHLGKDNIEVSSDGDVEDWVEGLALAKKVIPTLRMPFNS